MGNWLGASTTYSNSNNNNLNIITSHRIIPINNFLILFTCVWSVTDGRTESHAYWLLTKMRYEIHKEFKVNENRSVAIYCQLVYKSFKWYNTTHGCHLLVWHLKIMWLLPAMTNTITAKHVKNFVMKIQYIYHNYSLYLKQKIWLEFRTIRWFVCGT